MTRKGLNILCAVGIIVTGSLAAAQEQSRNTATSSISTAGAERVSTPVVARLERSPAVDLSGNPIGQIEEIVLSPTGSAEAAILIASDKRLVPIPWTFLRASGDTNLRAAGPSRRLVFTVAVDLKTLGKAPGFAADQWPDTSNPTWLQASAGFFGLAREEAVGGVGTGASTIAGASARADQTAASETGVAVATNRLATGSSPITPTVSGTSAQPPNRDAKPTKQP